jgi:hypothetical protein
LRQVDALLLDREKRVNVSYAEIRKTLNRVPRAERGLDWTERVVALYCVKQMKEARSSALKINIRNMRLEEAETQPLDAFNNRLRDTLAPMVLTNHGLHLPFAARDQDEVAQDLKELFVLLKSLGYTAFINSGTLLGAVREKAFLGHDDDADLAVLINGATDLDVVESLQRLCKQLNQSGKLLEPAWHHKKGPMLKVRVGSGVEVDLFPLWFRNAKAFIWPHTYGELSEDDIFPLSTQVLCGASMPAPKDAEKMLARNYGEGWRVPDPDYFFPWDEAKERFVSMLDAYFQEQGSTSIIRKLKLLLRGKRK